MTVIIPTTSIYERCILPQVAFSNLALVLSWCSFLSDPSRSNSSRLSEDKTSSELCQYSRSKDDIPPPPLHYLRNAHVNRCRRCPPDSTTYTDFISRRLVSLYAPRRLSETVSDTAHGVRLDGLGAGVNIAYGPGADFVRFAFGANAWSTLTVADGGRKGICR